MKIIYGLLAIIGIGITISLANGSAYEIPMRFIGIILLAIGAYLGGWMDDIKKKKGEKQ